MNEYRSAGARQIRRRLADRNVLTKEKTVKLALATGLLVALMQ